MQAINHAAIHVSQLSHNKYGPKKILQTLQHCPFQDIPNISGKLPYEWRSFFRVLVKGKIGDLRSEYNEMSAFNQVFEML